MSNEFDLDQGVDKIPEPAAELNALKARLAEQEARAKEMEAAYRESQQNAARLTDYVTNQLAQGSPQAPVATPRGAPPATPASSAPDKDEDPDAYIEWVINQRVNQAIEASVGPMRQTYEMDRRVMMGTAETTAINTIKSQYADFGSLSKEVGLYMQQLDPTLRADAHAWEHAYFIVKGQKAVQAEREANTRAAAADDGRGRPSAPSIDGLSAPPSAIPRAAEKLARYEKMSQSDWEDWGEVRDIDDFKRLQAKKAKAGGR